MRTFGLIGQPLSHSFSKKYFTEKFEREGILESHYKLFPLESSKEFQSLIAEQKNLIGLNVTIPYKQEIIPYLHELDQVAEAIGAVNTIKIERKGNGKVKLKGYNTDALGFQQSLKPFLAKEHERALVFGSGGAAKAVCYVLNQLGIPFFIVSRNPSGEKEISYSDLDQTSISRFQLLINCTPIGMFPNINQTLPISMESIGENHLVYDLIYNPIETKFLAKAKEKRAITLNGLSMLKLQAEAAWNIWNSKT